MTRRITVEALGASLAIALVLIVRSCLVLTEPYVSPGVVSLIPWNSVLVCGPIAAVGGALAAAWYCEPHSPVTGSSVVTADGRLALRELLSFLIPTVVTFSVVSLCIVPLISLQASGGSIDWVRVITGIVVFIPCPVLGFFLGLLLHGLWSTIVALGATLIILFLPSAVMEAVRPLGPLKPLTAPAVFGGYVSYAVPLGRPTLWWFVLYAMWIVVTILGMAMVVGLQRNRSRYGSGLLAGSTIAALTTVIGVPAWAGITEPVLSGDYVSNASVCGDTLSGARVCVAEEEQVQLEMVVQLVDDIHHRLGIDSSSDVYSSYLVMGQDSDHRFVLPYNENTAFEVAAATSGLNECQSDSRELDFAFALTLWIIDDADVRARVASGTGFPEETTLFQMEGEDVRRLYTTHRREINNCDMTVDRFVSSAD